MLRNAHIPKRRLPDGSQDPAYALALNKTHAAVLGVSMRQNVVSSSVLD